MIPASTPTPTPEQAETMKWITNSYREVVAGGITHANAWEYVKRGNEGNVYGPRVPPALLAAAVVNAGGTPGTTSSSGPFTGGGLLDLITSIYNLATKAPPPAVPPPPPPSVNTPVRGFKPLPIRMPTAPSIPMEAPDYARAAGSESFQGATQLPQTPPMGDWLKKLLGIG
jgi:hypothetical protein